MLKKRFFLFFMKNRKRRFKFQKNKFLKDYLNYFNDLNFVINKEDKVIFIGNRIDPKITFVCRYNTKRQLPDRASRYYPLRNSDNNRERHDQLIRIAIILMLFLLYSRLFNILNHLYLSFFFMLLIIIVIIGKSNYLNFSSTGSLFLLQELALCVNVNEVLFVIYDDYKNQYFSLENPAYTKIVYLDKLVYGSDLLIATRNIQLSELNTNDLEDSVSIFHVKLSNDVFKQFNAKGKLLILALGFKENNELYCKYIDTSNDTTLDLVIYSKILNFLKQLVQYDTD